MSTLETRDWAHLPPELLEMIAARLTDIFDRGRFSSVCSQWRSASKSASHSLPPQLPWLLLPQVIADNSSSDATVTRHFFSFCRPRKRIFALSLPETRKTRTNKIFPSPRGGWIVTPTGTETLALVNPLTRSTIPLPPLPLTESRRKNIGAFVLRKAKVFESDLVAVLFPDGRDLLFCRPGDSRWKRLDMTLCYPNSDFAYYKGRFFVIDSTKETVWVFDAETLLKVGKIPFAPALSVCNYLVELLSGELLLVRRTTGDCCQKFKFRLFRLEESGVQRKWVKVNSVGDDVLFVDGLQAMAFDARNFNGWRGNCIYFVDYFQEPKHKALMRFDIGEGQIERVPLFTFTSSGYWGKAMWVVPTLC